MTCWDTNLLLCLVKSKPNKLPYSLIYQAAEHLKSIVVLTDLILLPLILK